MKILFIRPNMINERQSDAMEPLAFAVLTGLTPKEFTTKLYDDRVEKIDFDEPCDLVAISVETFTAKRAYHIAAEFKKRKRKVVMGGFHVTFLPEEALMFCDTVVIGDAEISWPLLLKDLQNNSLQRIYHHRVSHMQNLVYDRDIFKNKRYTRISPVQFSRGCKHHCDFCSIKAFYGNALMQRPIDDLIAEIKTIPNKYIFFADDNLFLHRTLATELFERLIPLNVKWACQVSLDVARDEKLLELMRRSGCISALIGFESLDDKNLAQMRKNVNAKYEYKEIVARFNQSAIMLFGTFVIGYDHDTTSSFDRTLEFALDSKLCLAQFNSLMPMPGTTLYDTFQKEGRLIFEKWWLDPNYRYGDAMFIPKNMSPEELRDGVHDIRMRFNRYSSIFKRSLSKANTGGMSNFLWYVVTNMVTKREILRKNNRHLGV